MRRSAKAILTRADRGQVHLARMVGGTWWVTIGAGLVAAIGLVLDDTSRILVRGALYGVVAIAGAATLRRQAEPGAAGEFWILTGSCTLFAISNGVRYLDPAAALGELLNGGGGLLLLLAGAVFVRHVRPGNGRPLILDGLIVGMVATLVIREAVVLTGGSAGVQSLPAVFLTVGLVGASLWLRAVSTVPSVPIKLFAAATILAIVSMLLVVLGGMGAARPALVDLFTLLSTVVLVRAMTHPTLGRQLPVDTPARRPLRRVGLVGLVLALSALPATVWGRIVVGEPPDVMLAVLLSTLTVTWVLRFSEVLHDWHTHQVELHDQLLTDPLTGAASRRHLMTHLDERIAVRDEGVTVVFIDLDDFKAVNDRHGHAAGDQLLIAVARRLRTAVVDDDLVARVSGDEFVVVTGDDAPDLVDRIRALFSEVVGLPNGLLVPTRLSIGTASLDPLTDSATDVLDRADRAMYRTKHAQPGRSQARRSTDMVADSC